MKGHDMGRGGKREREGEKMGEEKGGGGALVSTLSYTLFSPFWRLWSDPKTGPHCSNYERCSCFYLTSWGSCRYQIFIVGLLKLFHFTTDRRQMSQIGDHILHISTVRFSSSKVLINNN